MAETCAVTGTSGLAERNRNYGKQALALIGDLQKEGYLSDVDVSLAKTLLSGCDTYINRQVHDNLKITIESLKSTPITGIFPSEEAKKSAFQAVFKKTISDPNEDKKTDDSAEEDSKRGNVNTAISTLLLAIGTAKKVACGEKEYTPPKPLTSKQTEDSKVLPGPNAQNKEGVLANLIKQAEKETPEKKAEIWANAFEKSEANWTKLSNPSEEAKAEHDLAMALGRTAKFSRDNKDFDQAVKQYQEALSAQPASVFPLK